MRALLTIFVAAILLSGCAATGPFHSVLGSDSGWSGANVTVHLDASVSGLRIRHVSKPCSDPKNSSGRWDHLELDGFIGPDSTKAVELLLPKMQYCVNRKGYQVTSPTVYLNSAGGLLVDGFEMGRLFREHQVFAILTQGQVCASACATAFTGAFVRVMEFDSQLMFHAPYLQITSRSIDCSDRGQVGDLRDYFVEMLNEAEGAFLHERTMDYCSQTDGWVLNSDAANLFGLANGMTLQNLDNASSIDVGSTLEQVRRIMQDEPVLRVLDKEPISEWHYCSTGQFSDHFLIFYFQGNHLIATKTYSFDEGAFGPCEINVQKGEYSNVPKVVAERRIRYL